MVYQVLTNAIVAASVYAMVGISFTLIYRVAGFINFSHAAVVVSGPYCVFLLGTVLGLRSWLTYPLAIFGATSIGIALWQCLYRPMKRSGASPLVMLLASLGAYVCIQNLFSLVFGDETRSIRPVDVFQVVVWHGVRVTTIQITTVLVSLLVVTLLVLFLRTSRLGISMRAVAENSQLAETVGIDAEKVIAVGFILGSLIAGLAGILVALDVDMTPRMGMNMLMMGVVAATVGGVESIGGVALGALLLALARNFGAWTFSSQWQDAIVFVVLLAFLLIRPRGFLGKETR